VRGQKVDGGAHGWRLWVCTMGRGKGSEEMFWFISQFREVRSWSGEDEWPQTDTNRHKQTLTDAPKSQKGVRIGENGPQNMRLIRPSLRMMGVREIMRVWHQSGSA